jgi:hypothetical protein
LPLQLGSITPWPNQPPIHLCLHLTLQSLWHPCKSPRNITAAPPHYFQSIPANQNQAITKPQTLTLCHPSTVQHHGITIQSSTSIPITSLTGNTIPFTSPPSSITRALPWPHNPNQHHLTILNYPPLPINTTAKITCKFTVHINSESQSTTSPESIDAAPPVLRRR